MTTDTAAFRDHTYEFRLADGRTLGYGLYGASDGPLVVVLDGPGSRGLARAMGSPAAQLGIKLLAPDRPGFGCSTPARAGSIATVSRDLLALVDHLGFRRFGLVAQSGGTPYALAVAAAAGDQVTGLAFVGGLAPLDEPRAMKDVPRLMRIAFVLARRAPWVMRLFLNGLARKTAKDPETVARKFAANMPPDDRRVLADPTLWAIHATSSAEIVSRPAAFVRETRMLVRPWSIDYGRISAPAALWVGELDRTHPPSMSGRLGKLLGEAPVTIVAGAATFAMLPCFPDVLRHAAALPEDGRRVDGKRCGRNPLPAMKRSDPGPTRRADSPEVTMAQLSAEPTETIRSTMTLPPGPRWLGPVQTVWYTFAQPSFFAASRARYGLTWTMRLPNFPPLVVTRDRDAIGRLFTGDPLVRRHGNDLFKSAFGERSVMLLEPAEHLDRRRMELPPFHGQAVRSYTDRIRQLITTELETWTPGRVLATHPPARAVTLEIILELVLGVRDPELQAELAAIFDSFNTPLSKLALFLPTTLGRRAWWNPIAKPAFARVDRMRGLLSAHIARTRTDPLLGQRDDVLAVLVRARDQDGHGLSDVDLRDELVTLVAAGHETTATAMAWACDLLAHHSAVVTRLRDTLAAGEREYLKATVKELLRVRTIVYVAATRKMLEPFPIDDWILGPDVLILVDAQGVHGDPELYPEPQAFRPERFLAAPPDSYAYIPFGGGAHRCLGSALATLELELFIEELVNHVDLAPARPPARPVRRGVTLAPSTHGLVRIARAPRRAIKSSHGCTVGTPSTRSRT